MIFIKLTPGNHDEQDVQALKDMMQQLGEELKRFDRAIINSRSRGFYMAAAQRLRDSCDEVVQEAGRRGFYVPQAEQTLKYAEVEAWRN